VKVFAQTKNGKIFKCQKCSAIHIEYKNLNFNLKEQEFERFANYIRGLDGKEWEKKNAHSDFNRKILLPVGSGYFNAMFNNDELEEFKELLQFRKKSIPPYQQTIKAGKLEFTSILN